MTFEIVPDLLGRIELRRRRRQLFDLPPGVGLAPRREGRTPMHRAALPRQDDLSPQMPPERSKTASDREGLEGARLEAEGQAQVLALWGYRESRQRREAVMVVVVWDDRHVPLGGPGPAAGGRSSKPLAFRKAR